MGYHKVSIQKGTVGFFSKIKEEFLELEDATKQDNPILILVEMSDLIGAMKLYLERNCPCLSMGDLEKMADATISAFKDGTRK